LFKAGDEAAAEELWRRYFPRLVGLCRKKLAQHPRRAQDEEDVALSAFESLWEGVQKGRFPQLSDRDDLWQLLVVIAARKAIDEIERGTRLKRGAGRVRGESGIVCDRTATDEYGIEQVIGNEPTPEFAALVTEEYNRLLESLGDKVLQTIANSKLEGYTNREIAESLGRSVRTIERKLRLIRKKWSHEDTDRG